LYGHAASVSDQNSPQRHREKEKRDIAAVLLSAAINPFFLIASPCSCFRVDEPFDAESHHFKPAVSLIAEISLFSASSVSLW
jgi:hypothetical protein